MRIRFAVFLALLALPVFAQDPGAIWKSLQQPPFDPAKTATVEVLVLKRDRIAIELQSGTIAFTEPVAGVVFGAAFRGEGRVRVAPPTEQEARQLLLNAEQASLDLAFSDAIFSFSDKTFEEVAAVVQWRSGGADFAAKLYQDRQDERESYGAGVVPRLFRSLLSGNRARTALFAADLKTKDKGWIHVRFDALEPEEISVGRWSLWGPGYNGFDSWLSFPAGNRTSADAYHDPMAKEDGVLREYTIHAAVTGKAELSAETELLFEPKVSGERALLFILDSNLRLSAVQDAQGKPLTFFQPRDPKDNSQDYGDYLVVTLPEPTQVGQPVRMKFNYEGKRVVRQVGSGNYFCQSFGWYPTRENSFAARADFHIIFRSPKKYVLVATGNKVSETTDGDWRVTEWKSEIPLAVAGFAFGDYKVQVEKVGDLEVQVYANRQADDVLHTIELLAGGGMPGARGDLPIGSLSPSLLAKSMGQELGNTLRVFEKYFGPYPYKHLAVTNIPFSYGQGWPSLIYLSSLSFLDSTQRQLLGITEHRLLTDFFRAHESSHQWWGHRVGWKSYHDQWLSEGFAQFSGNLYVQYRRNEKEYLARLREDKLELKAGDRKGRRYDSIGSVWMGTRLSTGDSPGAYSTVIYNKGGYVLHMLRMIFFDPRAPAGKDPEGRFIAMMQDFCNTYHNKPASTEDFKAIVEKHMPPVMDVEGNGRADWFFRQYVYGTGMAEYQFSYKVEPTPDGKFKVQGQVTQSGVPDGWRDTLPLYVELQGRTVRMGLLRVREKNTSFEFLMPSKPDKLILNSNEDILAEIKQ